ncbi:exodeoxyribonuclease VII large subunit [Erysipelothrix sp. D19-032]
MKEVFAAADIERTLHERWPVAQVHVLYAFVQGEYAVDSIVKQIDYANTLNLDTIILARGGGSIEDLWSFNEPKVVEAVYNSKTPIISGVGHESDVTLVDYVSDYRVATPTNAAVHATPNTKDLLENLRDYKNAYYKSVRNKLRQNRQVYQTIMSQRYLQDPLRYIETKQQYLDYHRTK